MRHLALAAAFVCALAAGSAWAADYDDSVSGDWNVPGTWMSSPDTGDYPQSADDDVLIDSGTVKVPSAYTPFPGIGSISIGGSGTLEFGRDSDSPGSWTVGAPVEFTGGGVLSTFRNKTTTFQGALSVTGGTSYIEVGYAGTSELAAGVSSTTSDCKIVVQKHPVPAAPGMLKLSAASPGYSGEWEFTIPVTIKADSALGTGTVTCGGGSRADLLFDAASQSGPGPASITFGGRVMTVDKGSIVNWSNDPVLTLDGVSDHVMLRSGSDWQDPVHLATTTTFRTYAGGFITGPISSPADVALEYNWSAGKLTLGGDNSNFLGDIHLVAGSVELVQETAPCQGTIIVEYQSTAGLMLYLADADGRTDWTLNNTITGGGTIRVEDGSGSYKLTVEGGTILGGWSAQPLTIDGALAFAVSAKGKGTLAAEIQGVWVDDDEDPETLDVLEDILSRKLAVDHDVSDLANGTLDVTLTDLTLTDLADFYAGPPSAWPAYEVLTCANDLPTAGERFGTVSFPQGVGGPVSYTYSEKAGTTVTVQVTMPGDTDLSGAVDYLDLGVLATYYDLSGGWGEGDFTHDGKIDYLDLGILATNYDLTIGSAKGAAAVPEPVTISLLGLGCLLAVVRRRR